MFFKTIALFAAIMLMAIVSATTAASLNSPFDFEIDPVETLENNDMGLTVDQSESQHGLRQKRAACDLLTFLPVPGDSMCAASCIAARRGFKGGFCTKRKVCRCRF